MKATSLWEFIKSVDTQLCELINHVVCSVCQELFNNPVSTPCGHSFCSGCIKRVLSIKDNSGCPLCKHSISRYSLETDKAKQIFSQIFRQLPKAFLNDVNHLSSIFKEKTPDIVKSSKLFQLSPQKNLINSRSCKTKYLSKSHSLESFNNEESESIAPVFRHTKNLIKYKTPKEKRKDDFVSISQAEPLSGLSILESTKLGKELNSIEIVPPSQKVKEWFTSAGGHLFHTSPGQSPLLTSDGENNEVLPTVQLHSSCQNITTINSEKKPSTMIRVNYTKEAKANKNGPDKKVIYESVPDLNEKSMKENQTGKNAMEKTFKIKSTIHLKSLKRNDVKVHESQVTASQIQPVVKDGQNLKSKEREVHGLLRVSSPQFLDVGCNSNNEVNELNDKVQDNPDSCYSKEGPQEETSSINDFANDRESVQGKFHRFKRLRNESFKDLSVVKKCYSHMISLSSSDALELENNMEKYLKRIIIDKGRGLGDSPQREPDSLKSTPLLSVLEEIVNDNIIYANYSEDVPIVGAVLSERKCDEVILSLTSENTEKVTDLSNQNQNFSQTLMGFSTQNGFPGDNVLNQMIATIEQELQLEEDLLIEKVSVEKAPRNKNLERHTPVDKIGPNVSINRPRSCNIKDMTFAQKFTIPFLKFGRLTPIAKRRKSSVVKLLFPAGLTSFSKKHKPTNHFETSSLSRPHHARPTKISSAAVHISDSSKTYLHQRDQVNEVAIQTEISSFQDNTSPDRTRYSSDSFQPLPRPTPSHETRPTPSQTIDALPFHNAPDFYADEISTSQKRKRLYHSPLKPNALDTTKKIKTTQSEEDCHVLLCTQSASNIKILHEAPFVLPSLESTPPTLRAPLIPNQNAQSPLAPPNKSVLTSSALDGNPIHGFEGTKGLASADTDTADLHIQQREQITNRLTQLLDNIQTPLVPPRKQIACTMREVPCNHDLENTEDSDSDFFVEQTPPKPNYMRVDDLKRFRTRSNTLTEEHQNEKNKRVAKELSCSKTETPVRFPETKHSRMASKVDNSRGSPLPQEGEQCVHPADDKSLKNYHQTINEHGAIFSKGKEEVPATSVAPNAWKNFDFAPQRKPKTPSRKNLCIVASSLKNPDTVRKFVSQFKLEYSNKPTKNMTHLVVGLHENEEGQTVPLCTPKLLFAMANKKWVVGETWLEASLAANKVLPEEHFETSDPLGGPACREARLSTDKLLKDSEICLLGNFNNILKEELADIILDSGGTLISRPNDFSYSPTKIRVIIVDKECVNISGKTLEGLHQKYRTVILSRDFLIMSIQSYNLSNFGPYMMHSASAKDLMAMGYPLRLVDEEDSYPRSE